MTRPSENLADFVLSGGRREDLALIDLLDAANPKTFTYGDLNAQSRAIASALKGHGLAVGDRIAIASANRAEFVTAYLGVLRAGMIAVPVNFKLPAATVDFILCDAGVKFIFADDKLAEAPQSLPVARFSQRSIGGLGDFLSENQSDQGSSGSSEIAMILYTSGSTGQPKGVPLSHRGHIWALKARSSGQALKRHRILVAAPLFHMNGLFATKLALANGAVLVLLPQFNPASYVRAISDHRCTWLTSVPTMLAMVARERDLLSRYDVSSVGVAAMGSAPVTEKLLDDVQRAFPKARLVLNYGITEAGPAIFGNHPAGVARPRMSVGYPVPEVDIRLLDTDGRVGSQGLMHLRTPAQMSGYHNRPDLTARVLTKDGWYITGDLMRRDENGFYFFVGRADDMFVCGGENIFPSEIEHVLERHPDVAEACVVPIPDELKGQKPVAFVVPRDGAVPSEADIKAFALRNAPAYQHPRHVVFKKELPLAGTNKVDRRLLTGEALQLFTTHPGALTS